MNGIERLQDMVKGQKDKYLIIIVNHLMLQTDMDAAFLKEEKNLKDMATYIKDQARKEETGNVAVIEDERVFQWAKDYFNKTNDELGIKKIENKKTQTTSKEIKDNDEFGSIFDTEEASNTNESKEEMDQITLFGM